ncbi:MAG: hypothetical protein Q8R36_02965 [bacterium]|nr:hypothetical protein [bacterium]
MFNTISKKFLLGFVGIIVVGVAVWVWGMYLNPEVREKRVLLDYFANLEEEYRSDTYGGATPEETLALFITALEAGDIELASKYFLPDDREEIKSYFQTIREQNEWEKVLNDARNLKLTTARDEEAFYTIANTNNVVEVQVILKKNPNGVWKITEL